MTPPPKHTSIVDLLWQGLDAILLKNTRPSDPKRQYFYVTEFVSCARARVFDARREADRSTPKSLQQTFRDGNRIESDILELLRASGVQTIEGRSVRSTISIGKDRPSVLVSGRLDVEVFDRGPTPIIVEIKSINDEGYRLADRVGPQGTHERQLRMYLWMTGTQRGRVVYRNKNAPVYLEFVVGDDDSDDERGGFHSWVHRQAGRLVAPDRREDLPFAEDSIAELVGDEHGCRFCSHYSRCFSLPLGITVAKG